MLLGSPETVLAENIVARYPGRELADALVEVDLGFYRPMIRLGATRPQLYEAWWRTIGAPLLDSLPLDRLGY